MRLCGRHILYCSRITKNVTENREQTDRQRTEKPIIEATLLPYRADQSQELLFLDHNEAVDILGIELDQISRK